MEKDLNELRSKNAKIKKKNFETLNNIPSLQFVNNIDLYDFDLDKKKYKIIFQICMNQIRKLIEISKYIIILFAMNVKSRQLLEQDIKVNLAIKTIVKVV